MNRFLYFLTTSTDPWYYLSDLGIDEKVTEKMYFYSGIYQVLKAVGVLGATITLLIALIKLLNGNPDQRATLKDVLTTKVIILIGIFACAYIFGYILGVVQMM